MRRRVGVRGERELEARRATGSVGPSSGCGARAVGRRVEVRAARQAEAGEVVEQRRDVLVASGGSDDGQPAGELDRAHVDQAERHLGLRRIALRQRSCTCSFWRISEVVTPISGRLMTEHPRVLAAAVLRRVDDQRALVEGDAREPAGHDVHLLAAGDRKRAQVDVARLEARRR